MIFFFNAQNIIKKKKTTHGPESPNNINKETEKATPLTTQQVTEQLQQKIAASKPVEGSLLFFFAKEKKEKHK